MLVCAIGILEAKARGRSRHLDREVVALFENWLEQVECRSKLPPFDHCRGIRNGIGCGERTRTEQIRQEKGHLPRLRCLPLDPIQTHRQMVEGR